MWLTLQMSRIATTVRMYLRAVCLVLAITDNLIDEWLDEFDVVGDRKVVADG